MQREENDMLFQTNTNMSEIEVAKGLIIKNQKTERGFELYDIDKDSENNNINVNINFK